MSRSLAFTAEYFEVVYDGLLTSQRGFAAPSETRIVGHILTKLEEHAVQENIGPMTTYRLPDGKGATVTLTDEEYKLLVEALKQTKWSARGANKVTETMEWLEKVESS